MQVTVEIPEDLADALAPPGKDPSRAALEAFRLRRISGYQLRTLLGLPSRWDLHALLKERQIETYTVEDFEKDWATIRESRKKQETDIPG